MSCMRMQIRLGFTLLKAVLLLAVVATVAGLAATAIVQARRDVAVNNTLDNLAQCAKAAHLAHDQFKKFPPYYGVYGKYDTPLTFHAHLLPYVGQQGLYDNLVANATVPLYCTSQDPTRTNDGAGAANFPVNLRLFYTQGKTGQWDALFWTECDLPTDAGDVFGWDVQYAAVCDQVPGVGSGGSMWMDPGNNAVASPTAATFGSVMDRLWQEAEADGLRSVAGDGGQLYG